MSETLAYELISRGILCVIHQTLQGREKKYPEISYMFANADTTKGDQVRAIIKSGKINLATVIEQQKNRLLQGRPICAEI